MSNCNQCIVRQFNSLKTLTKDELVRISSCKTTSIIKKGEVLFNEGEHINGVFCIKDGICKVSKMSDNGREQIIHLIKKGDLLGERSLINAEVSNLKATAVNDMEVCFIPKEEIINDLQKNPNFTMDILKNMALSLKNADNVIVDMAQKTVKQRLALTLIYLDEKFPKKDNNAIDINLTREDIANIIGTATESAIRLLSEFKKKKYIQLTGKDIFILDLNGLTKESQGF
ncbi:Crp/Fnr family transcriptional regulator [Tenacibaculum todarodis]|uniref:Crp/Fnr family transcriptional regulator n=1 Tax=Tenacibaculum todarodis TaxID=1850252 RepID=A0A1L3JIY1_9FLAO|nr:Crp/Fnr family transcriptional regulator [Tenacibaculum todarodis]APG65100.1 Crp/Fnr family transcriptional regulator [Tenacibaculum todarodis]